MNKTYLPVLALAVAVPIFSAPIQRGENPFGAYDCAIQVLHADSTARIAKYIQAVVSDGVLPALKETCASELAAIKDTQENKANWFLLIAELMKGIGDYRAPDYYSKAIGYREAIGVNNDEAALHLFWGDYLRNFRGPQTPLFPQAEEQYFLARQTLSRVSGQKPPP